MRATTSRVPTRTTTTSAPVCSREPAGGDPGAVTRQLRGRAVRVPDADVDPVVAARQHLEDAVGAGALRPGLLGLERAPRRAGARARPARRSGRRRARHFRTSAATSAGGRASTATRPGTRIHFRWYAAYCRVRRATASIASSRGSSAASARPITLRAVVDSGPASARRASSATPASNIARADADPSLELLRRNVEPDDERRVPRLVRPEPILCGRSDGRPPRARAHGRPDAGRSGAERRPPRGRAPRARRERRRRLARRRAARTAHGRRPRARGGTSSSASAARR